MGNTMRLVTTLVGVCLVCGTVLALVNELTADEIRRQETRKEERLRAEVIAGPGNTVEFDEPIAVEGRQYFVGRRPDGSHAGTVFAVETDKGYAGKIRLIVGIAPGGREIAGVRILKHGETPGLGARIVEVAPKEDEPWFLGQFKGLGSDQLYVKQDKPTGAVDAITAATISSRAVADAVREALDHFVQTVAPKLETAKLEVP